MDKTKRQKKYISVSKLIAASLICFLVIGSYATRVNQASTRGYFLKQETKKYDALLFQRSIVQLDNLQLERKLYDDVFKSRSSRYEDDGNRLVVTIGKASEPTIPQDVFPDIALSELAPENSSGVITVFEYEE